MSEVAIHWTEYASALGPTLIGFGVIYIAFQQWRVNRDTFREKLFDRRIKVFETVHRAMSEVIAEIDSTKQTIDELTRAYQKSHFLFRKDLSDYILQVREKCIEIHEANREYNHDPVAANADGWVAKKHDNARWINDQLDTSLWKKFEHYIGFRNR